MDLRQCQNCMEYAETQYYKPCNLELCPDCWPDRETFRRIGESLEAFQLRVMGLSYRD